MCRMLPVGELNATKLQLPLQVPSSLLLDLVNSKTLPMPWSTLPKSSTILRWSSSLKSLLNNLVTLYVCPTLFSIPLLTRAFLYVYSLTAFKSLIARAHPKMLSWMDSSIVNSRDPISPSLAVISRETSLLDLVHLLTPLVLALRSLTARSPMGNNWIPS